MKKIISKIHPKIRDFILILGFSIIVSITWNVIFASSNIPSPTNLIPTSTVSGITTTVSLNWDYTPGINIDTFKIERQLATPAGANWQNISTIPGTIFISTDTITNTNTTNTSTIYLYRVSACQNSSGVSSICSDPSNIVEVIIPAYNPNNTCTNLTLTLDKTTYTIGEIINYTWTCIPPGTIGNVSSYIKKLSNTTMVSINPISSGSTQTMTYSTSNIQTGAGSYNLIVCLGDSCTTGSSSQSFALVLNGGGGTNPPLPPTTLSFTPSTSASSNIILHWVNPSSNNANGFEIQRKLHTETTWGNSALITGVNSNSYANMINTNTLYDYQIRSCIFTSGATSICSEYVLLENVIIQANTPNLPLPPTYLTSISTSNSVSLNWIYNVTNISRFKVERKLSSEPTTAWILLPQINTTITPTYNDSSVITEKIYNYRVRACQNVSETALICSEPSNEITVTIPSIIPVNIACNSINLNMNKTAYTIGESVNYTWTCSPLNTTGNVSIWLQSPNGINTIKATGSSSSTQTMSLTTSNLATGVYTLKACLGSSCSTANTIQSSKTFMLISPLITISPPTNLLSTVTSSYILLSWTNNTTNINRYSIERKLSSQFAASWTLLPQANTATPLFKDSNVTSGATYDYRIRACVETNCSNPALISNIYVPIPIIEATPIKIIDKPSVVPTNITINKPIVPVVTSIVIPNTISSPDIPLIKVAPSEVPLKINNLSSAIEESQKQIDTIKIQLIKIIDENIANIIKNADTTGQGIDTSRIYDYRNKLVKKIEFRLSILINITPNDIDNLKIEVSRGIEDIKTLSGINIASNQLPKTDGENVVKVFDTLSDIASNQNQIIKKQGGDLLYKDTNNDGISNYDSLYVYNIDPVKPSIISSFEGKSIGAAEKILLGFDPTKTELVKIKVEEPLESIAKIIPSYKINNVDLVNKKEVTIKGQALPNSYVTVYIYSTPIVVTIKTDITGEWSYTLDKELDNGDHTVYVATVNNMGNIVAKSPGYPFTKTAEAVTLNDIPIPQASIETGKPGLLEGSNLFILISIFIVIIILILVLTGIISKKDNQNQNLVQ